MANQTGHRPWLVALASLSLLTSLASAAAGATNVLTHQYGNARTGANLDERVLTTTTVGSANFGKMWTLFADGQVVAQPLYVSSLRSIPRAIPASRSFKGTLQRGHHRDDAQHGVRLRRRQGESRRRTGGRFRCGPRGSVLPRPGGKDIDMWSTNDPEWGILSTPVISADKQTLFVVAWHDDGPDGFRYRLHALDLKNGAHRRPPVVDRRRLDRSRRSRASRRAPFNPCAHKQRAALLLSQGVVYVGFGGDGNRGVLVRLRRRRRWRSGRSGIRRPPATERRHLAIRAGAGRRCRGQRLSDDRQRDVRCATREARTTATAS